MPQLEQHIMEGSYNKVLSAKQDGQYAKEGMFFMDMLVDTVRDEIAECSEKAYTSIKLADLQALLMLGSEAELREFAETVPWPSALPSPSCPWPSCIYISALALPPPPRRPLSGVCRAGAERMGDAGRERHLRRHLREGGGAAGVADDPADPQLREGARKDRLTRGRRAAAAAFVNRVGWRQWDDF